MTTITLPPTGIHPGESVTMSDAQLRARDLEVARLVLEGAKALVKSRQAHEAKAMAHHMPTWYAASQYHADRLTAAAQMLDILDLLEVKHHE
jgi:mevalonate pyrophosphate decarboxylase